MKWALIYLLASGIWDTGLRYDTRSECAKTGNLEVPRHIAQSDPDWNTLQKSWICVPSKE